MKYRWDKKYLYWGVTALCVVILSIAFFWLITKWNLISDSLSALFGMLSSVIVGMVIAYLLSPLVNLLEKRCISGLSKRLFQRHERRAWAFSRGVSIILVLLALVVVLIGLLLLVLPRLYYSIEGLVNNIPGYYKQVSIWVAEFLEDNPDRGETINNIIANAVAYFTDWVESSLMPKIDTVIYSISTGVIIVIKSIFNFLIGVIVSVYLMYNKEVMAAQCKKIFFAVMKKARAAALLRNIGYIHKTFGGFIKGKIFSSLIVGVATAAFMLVTGMPYAALISVIIGITDLIPFFGPYIGAIPSAFILLLESPLQCVIFIIFIFVLQAIDGNIIGPRVWGESIGLPGFWVIFAILLGEGLGGLVGMFIGVPIFAVIYTAIRNYCVKKLARRGFPTSTGAYRKAVDQIFDERPADEPKTDEEIK